jgi:peptide/nickel transport system substrate-binding protein
MSARSVWAAEPVRGGTITYAKEAEVTSLDPHTDYYGISWRIFFMVYDQLLSMGDNFGIEPGLAESWQQTSATQYVFNLRKNAKFSNGRPVVAADVVGSLERILDPKTAAFWKTQLGPISKLEADGDHVVRLEVERPHTQLLGALTGASASIIPIAEMKSGKFDPKKTLLGSGPFKVAEHLQDQSWTLERNPYYWRTGYPIADKLAILIIPDDSARIAALRDGRADIGVFLRPDTPSLLSGIDNITVVVQGSSNYYRLDFNSIWEKSPFRDKRLRQAVNLTIDRPKIVSIALAGNATVDYPIPAAFSSVHACRDLPSYTIPREERLKKARALVKEAGADGIQVNLIASPDEPAFPKIAQVIQEDLAGIGLKVNILQLPTPQWLDAHFVKSQFDFAISWFAGYSDPAMVLSWWDPTFAVWNKKFVTYDPKLGDLLAKIQTIPNGPEREDLFEKACLIIDDQASMIALASKNDIIAYRNDLITAKINKIEGYVDTLKYVWEYARLKT